MIALGIQLCLCLAAQTPGQEGAEKESDFAYRLELAHTLSLLGGRIQAADVSPDGRYLVTGGPLGDVVLCDMETLEIRPIAQLSDRGVWSAAFSPNGKWIAVGGDRLLVLTPAGDVVFSRTAFDCSGLAWTGDSAQLAASVNTEGVILLDTATWEIENRILSPTSHGGALRYVDQETGLLMQEYSGRLWRADVSDDDFLPITPKPKHIWRKTPYQSFRDWFWRVRQERHRPFLIRSVANGQSMTLNLRRGWLHIGSAQEGTKLFAYLQKTPVDDIAFSPASEYLCATGEGTSIFRLEDGAALHHFAGERSISRGTENGTFLMAYPKGLVQLEAESGFIQHQIFRPEEMKHKGHNLFGGWNQGKRKMTLSPDGTTLFMGGGFLEIRHPLIHLPTSEWKAIRFSNRITDIAWLPDSSAFLIAGSESQHGYSGSLGLIQSDGTWLTQIRQTGGDEGGPAISVTASPDGSRVVYSTTRSRWIGGESYPQAQVVASESLKIMQSFTWPPFEGQPLLWVRYLDEETLLCIGGPWQNPALGLVQEQDLTRFQRLQGLKGTLAVLSTRKDYVAVGEGSQIRVFRVHKTP